MGRPESGGRAESGEREGANRSFVRPSLQDLLRFPAVRDFEFPKREKTDLPYFLRTLTVDFFRRPGRIRQLENTLGHSLDNENCESLRIFLASEVARRTAD